MLCFFIMLLPINEYITAQTVGPSKPSNDEEYTIYEDDEYSVTNNINTSQIGGVITVFFFLIIILAAAAGGIYYYMQLLKKKDREEKSKKSVLLEIRVPRGNEIEPAVAEQMFSNLYGIGGGGDGIKKYITVKHCISFEIVGLPGEIRFYVHCPKKLTELVEQQILGSYQSAEVRIVDEHNIFDENSKVAYTSLVLTDEQYYPIKTLDSFKGDPLANIISPLAKLEEGEGILIQLVISPAGSKWQKNGQKFLEKVESNNSDPEKKKIHVSQEQSQGINKKTGKIGYNTAVRIIASSKTEDLASMHVSNVVGAFEQFSNPGVNDFKKVKLNKLKEREFMHDVIYRRMPLSKDHYSVLNVEELATILHYPNKNITTPNISWLLAKELPAATWISSEVGSKDTIWLGDNIYRGVRKRVCFKRDDRRRHCFILGQTGSGKSMLMLRMMYQDICNGDGICYIDPHGSDAQKLLAAIPHERAEDVIYFNAADFERPMGFNLMEWQNEHDKHRIINGFIDLLKKMFDPHNQGIVGPILERAFRNSMLTAMEEEGTTLLEVLRIMTDQTWVDKKWIPLIKDDLVKRYWTDQIAKTSDFHKSETLGYLTSKFDRFVTNLALRNIIAQSKSSFNFREAMDNKKIIIINLAKGLIGEMNAQFLGLLIIPKIISSALSREDIPEDQRQDFFLYVDEFQNFATDEFVSILSEARKYRLCLTVGTQFVAQIQENIRNAVFGNVGSMLIARTGADDSKLLESQFEPHLTATDLGNQPNIHYYTKLLADGKYPPPFSLETGFGKAFPESGFDLPNNKEIADLVKQLSRLRYGRDANLVQEEIAKRAELSVNPQPEKGGLPPLPLK